MFHHHLVTFTRLDWIGLDWIAENSSSISRNVLVISILNHRSCTNLQRYLPYFRHRFSWLIFVSFIFTDFFRTASPQIIRVLHEPFLDMMSKSAVLSRALSNSGLYVTSLVKRLCTSDAIVLRSLLKMVQLLHQYHPNPRQFVLDNDLYNVAKRFAQSEVQVLVHQIANRLLTEFQNSTLT